jgi:hypothetical protein
MLRRSFTTLAVAATLVAASAPAAHADHVPVGTGAPAGLPADLPTLQVGDWRFIKNFGAGPAGVPPLGVDWDVFERDGRRYIIASSMTMGLTILDVTNPLSPVRVSDYASAFGCAQAGPQVMLDNLNKGSFDFDPFAAMSGWENDLSITPDGKIAIIGTDAKGRCHDPNGGGIELVDTSDVSHPRLIHLVRTPGMAHSVTVDPAHPWLAYLSTSDGQDGIDIVDFRTCLGGAAQKEACRPTIARAVLRHSWTRGNETPSSFGCHDIRFRGNRAYCAAINATLILDTTGVLNAAGRLTGTNLAAPGLTGGCPVIDADPVTAPGAKVTDCSSWTVDAFKERGAQSVQFRLVSAVHHGGSRTTQPANEDIQIAHQAEAIAGGRIMLVTDERGGGFDTGTCPSGGVWFFNITDETHPRLMRLPDGSPAVFRTEHTVPTGANCTVHYGTQFEDENLLVFAWYTQGTHVFRYTPDFAKNQIAFDEVAVYVPAAASTWTAKGLMRSPDDPDEILIYTADIVRGFDALAVRVPRLAPPAPQPKPSVLGTKHKPLPGTGTGETTTAGLMMVALAAWVALWRRKVRV